VRAEGGLRRVDGNRNLEASVLESKIQSTGARE